MSQGIGMTEPSWTTHVLAGAAWRRFGIMLLFAPVLCCAGFLIAFVALFQFFTVLASGETNPHLGSLGGELGRFAGAIIAFLTYNSERPPFPFAPWPGAGARERAPPARATKSGSRASPRRGGRGAGGRRAGAVRRRRAGARTGGKAEASPPPKASREKEAAPDEAGPERPPED